MSGITWYIFRQLGQGTVMVGVVLTLIVWLTQSLQFLQFVINKGLTIADWLRLTTLLLPSFIGVILPAALFFVVVFVYNKLIIDRELVVVQAAGVSRVGLAAPALLAAAAAVTVGYGLSLFGMPASYRSFPRSPVEPALQRLPGAGARGRLQHRRRRPDDLCARPRPGRRAGRRDRPRHPPGRHQHHPHGRTRRAQRRRQRPAY